MRECEPMAVIISLLRGINLGPKRQIRMEDLRALYESLKLRDVETFINSGNVLFRSEISDPRTLTKRIENGIEKRFGFHSDVVLRSSAEMRDAVARSPFSGRDGIDGSRLLVIFLAGEPKAEACARLLAIQAEPEECRFVGHTLFAYFPNGLARPKLSIPRIEKTLGVPATGRNWNTVQKLSALAEKMEAAAPAKKAGSTR